MTMLLQRPSSSASMRPAYLDNLYRDSPILSPSINSADSSSSYSSSTALDLRLSHPPPARPLSPSYEAYEEDAAENESVRSLRPTLSPRFQVRNIFNRRTFPQTRRASNASSTTSPTTVATPFSPILPTQPRSHTILRRPSLPKLQTSFSSPSRKAGSKKENLLPVAPVQTAKEISCHRCYYFAARRCNGWVMDGSHGDSCEQCLQAGYFGAP